MDTGDYTLEGHEETCIVERKGSLTELATNLLMDDYRRADAAFSRLSNSTRNPYLLVECSAAELRTRSKYVHEPARVVDALAAMMERYKLRLILCGRCNTITQKRTVGDMILRLMLAHAFQKEEDYSDVESVLSKLQERPELPDVEK